MNDFRSSHFDPQSYIDRAHRERAETLARVGYLLVRGGARIGRQPLQALRRIAARLRLWHDRHAATRALLLLDDRMLKDVGLTRGDIWAAVHGALPDRTPIAAAPAPAHDVALTGYALGGCNDNAPSRRAA
ncbi:MAG: DUF1127 domain-containing protein [Dongiaceae bacterium]